MANVFICFFLQRFLISIRQRVICTDLLSEVDKALVDDAGNQEANEKNGEAEGASKEKAIKLKGQNKKRPPPMKFDISNRICPSLVNVGQEEKPEPCPYEPMCNYRHDVEQYMKERKSDILPGGCYNYKVSGRCPRGISCLFGDEHVTPEGKNLENPTPSGPVSQYFNFLSKDLQKALRKKTYDFTKADALVKAINSNKKPPTVPKIDIQHEDEVQEPSAKKICVDKETGPVTDEGEITLKPAERKKVGKIATLISISHQVLTIMM